MEMDRRSRGIVIVSQTRDGRLLYMEQDLLSVAVSSTRKNILLSLPPSFRLSLYNLYVSDTLRPEFCRKVLTFCLLC